MSNACTPILVGVASLVLEMLLLSKTAKFPFMDYSPWSSINLTDRNRLKKFIQLGADITCIHTNFGGRGLHGFGNTLPSKTAKFLLGVAFLVLECIILAFKNGQFPFWTMDYNIVLGVKK